MCTENIDADLLAAASTHPPHATISATDPYAPADPQTWAKSLNLPYDVLRTGGHITPADGYGPCPAAW